MSKMDAVRAMREARYAEGQARAGQAAPKRAVRPTTPAKAPVAPEQPPAPGAAAEDLCGHRNMSGRTCTRERGHSAKSHRYS